MLDKSLTSGPPTANAVLDPARLGDIEGALGTILEGDIEGRATWKARFKTLLAIVGAGLTVMIGDNGAGAFPNLQPGWVELRHGPVVDAAAGARASSIRRWYSGWAL